MMKFICFSNIFLLLGLYECGKVIRLRRIKLWTWSFSFSEDYCDKFSRLLWPCAELATIPKLGRKSPCTFLPRRRWVSTPSSLRNAWFVLTLMCYCSNYHCVLTVYWLILTPSYATPDLSLFGLYCTNTHQKYPPNSTFWDSMPQDHRVRA